MGKSKDFWKASIKETNSYEDDYYGSYDSYGYGKNSWNSDEDVGKKRKYTSYTWEPTKWSFWGTSAYGVVDNNSNLFVKDPVSYETPSSHVISKKTDVWKSNSIDTIKELARVCYFKMIDEKDYISDKFSDVSKLSDTDAQDYEIKKQLYDEIYNKFIPGNTPLEQAIAIYKTLQDGDEYADKADRTEDGENFYSTLDFDRRIYCDPDINEQLEFNELSKERKMDILNVISIVGDLGQQFKVEKEISEKIVTNSSTYSKKIMRDYAQFSNIELYQKILPNFKAKLLTKSLSVNVPVDKKEQTQKIIILLDFSGSMDAISKQTWVNAILIDRLRYVMRGEAEVFFSYFVSDPDKLKFFHLKDREDVTKFWGWFSNDPNGGMTRIGDMVQKVSDCIEAKHLHNLKIDLSQEKPEILIINDGQDAVAQDTFVYKTNAITLMQENFKLKNLCIASGGKMVEIDYNNAVKAYDGQSVQLVSDGKKIKNV